MQGFELGLQPGLNANIDSFQIKNNSQSLENSQSFEKSTSTVSFMNLVQSEIQKSETKFENNSEVKTQIVQKDGTDASNNYSEKEIVSKKEETTNTDVNDANKLNKSELEEKKESQNDEYLQDKNIAVSLNNSEFKKVSKDLNQVKSKKVDNIKNSLQKQAKDLIENFDERITLNNFVDNKESDTELSFINQKDLLLNVESDAENLLLENSNIDFNKDAIAENFQENLKSKKTDKKLSNIISVTDLRSDKNNADTSKIVKKSDFITSVKQTSNDTVQVTMDLTNSAQKNILSLNNQNAASVGSNFQAMLENQISENATDFVKAGNIILKDNNTGKINLVLHPESLGNVKISLDLSDKVITGKIIVSSQEAFKAFNSTQENLRNAFIENGFENASFELSFANQNQNFSNARQEQQHYSAQVERAYDNFSVENDLVNENNSDIKTELQNYSINFVA